MQWLQICPFRELTSTLASAPALLLHFLLRLLSPDMMPATTVDTETSYVEVKPMHTPVECGKTQFDSLLPSADCAVAGNDTVASQKKKKKKKARKPSKPKEKQAVDDEQELRPPVLCISRNKHWRYISSYHVRLFTFFGNLS